MAQTHSGESTYDRLVGIGMIDPPMSRVEQVKVYLPQFTGVLESFCEWVASHELIYTCPACGAQGAYPLQTEQQFAEEFIRCRCGHYEGVRAFNPTLKTMANEKP